ncbi:hypothetical protein ES702_01046 [subsurface metagenome]
MQEFKKDERIRHKITKKKWVILEPVVEKGKLHSYRCRNEQYETQILKPEEIEMIPKPELKLEGTWKELLLSLRLINANIGEIAAVRHDESRDLDKLLAELQKLTMVLHHLFDKIEKHL